MDAKQFIIEGKTSLGIELGSTRIKAVLIGEDFSPIASGGHEWENRLEDGVWTYHLDDVWTGLQECYKNLAADVKRRFDLTLNKVGSIGVSAMMHGYLVFDRDGGQLAQFRTWRNTTTEKAAGELTALFNYNIPQRWSIAHLYQAMLNKEPHVPDIDFITTLAGYVHWKLTGEKVLGMGDASGVFPLDDGVYNPRMLAKFDELPAAKDLSRKLEDILPGIIKAGGTAGTLSAIGARMLDPSGALQAGIPFCPPEGDADTGMAATNSVSQRTGNISAGTSIFAMIVLEKNLSQVHPEIDMIATPSGRPVAMVHGNNCSTDLDAWVRIFAELIGLAGIHPDKAELYDSVYNKALEGDADCGGLIAYNYCSGEHMTGFTEGRPLFTRLPDSRFNLANFVRCLLFSAMGTIRLGMDILVKQENVSLDGILGHGGIFKTKYAATEPGVVQRLMAAALETPVTVMTSAGEGGAWGIALLAAFMLHGGGEALEDFLAKKVFAGSSGIKCEPDPEDVRGFKTYMKRYVSGLEIERAAVANLAD